MVTIRAYTWKEDEDMEIVSYFDDIDERSIRYNSSFHNGGSITFDRQYVGDGCHISFTLPIDSLLHLQLLENKGRLDGHDNDETVIVR